MKRTLCLFLALILAVGICFSAPVTITASAADSVSYVDYTWDEESKTLSSETKSVDTYTEITSTTTEMTSGWYVVNGEVTVAERMTATGEVHLILVDGAHLTASEGITVNEGNSLYIYGQSSDENTMGKLTATTTTDYDAAIGSLKANHAGTIVINGGNINASAFASGDGAGIGSAGKRGGYQITINAGVVTATSGNSSAAIGSGNNGGYGVRGTVHSICINGGVVNATVTANGGAAIGGGSSFDGGDITITGGTVTATNEDEGAAIGGGKYGSGGNITITGGNVTATYTHSVYYGVAIGAGYYGESAGNILITGGTVTATSTRGCGIGVYNGDNGRIVILGGTVNASGSGTVHINAGASGSMMLVDGTTVTISGDFTLQTDFVLPEGYTLEISEGATLTIPEGVTLTLPEEYTLVSNGTVNAVGTVNCITHKYVEGVCICGLECSHVGGTPTCTAPAVCTICGTAYGEVDPTNHNWENGVCTYGCNTIHEPHDWSGKDSICTVCGATCTHTGGEATCTEKAVCTICGASYGDFAPHTYENGKCTAEGCGYACTHENNKDENGICTVCYIAEGTCGASTNDGGESSVEWLYDSVSKTLTITGTGAMADYTGYDMPWYNYQSNITKVVIENGVTTIGDYAFAYCIFFTSVTMGDSVTSIGDSAFKECEKLETVTIGEAVQTIGSYAFDGCTSLASVTIGESVTKIGYSAFCGCISLKTIKIPNSVTTIDYGTFFNCTALESVTIGESVTTIGDNAFRCCTSLASLTIGDSVTTIGWQTFYGCTSLTSVTIGKGVTEIGDCAFKSCTSLTTIEIPDSVTAIGESAFYDCTSLTSVTIGKGVTEINDYAFEGCNKLSTVNVPCNWDGSIYSFAESILEFADHVTTKTATCISKAVCSVCGEYGDFAPHTYENGKGKCTVANCDNACAHEIITDGDCVACGGKHCGNTENDKVVWFCDATDDAPGDENDETLSILTITGSGDLAGYTFGGAPWEAYRESIRGIDIKDGVTSIGIGTFCGCVSLTSVIIPGSVKIIGDNAFSGCEKLSNVRISDGVISIGDDVFKECIALKEITIPESVTEIGEHAFNSCTMLMTITIPQNVTVIGEGAFCNCTRLTEINVDEGNTTYSSEDGVLFNEGKTELICCPAGKVGDYEVPSGVTSISNYAFSSRGEIFTVTIPVSVTTIGDFAFAGSQYVNLIVEPGSDAHTYAKTKSIPYIFNGCITEEETAQIEKLTFTEIRNDNEVIAYSVTGYDTPISGGLIIPETYKGKPVTEIGSNAFNDCSSLTSVIIPESIATISADAFNGCGNVTLIVELGSIAHIYAKDKKIKYVFKGCTEEESAQIKKLTFTKNSGGESYSVTFCDKEISGALNIPAIYNGKPVTEIGAEAFVTCTELTSVTIPESVTTIGENAFANCDTLNSVEILGNVTIIGAHTFEYCTSLSSITIPESVTTIGENAFAYCNNLSSITIPEGVTTIGDKAFSNCTKLETVTIGENVTTIGDGAFADCSSLSSVIIPNSVTTIGKNAFDSCTNLESVTIGENVGKIDDGTFGNCTSLKTIKIPDSVKTIGAYAFKDCSSLKEIAIPESVETIGANAFRTCEKLTEIIIPKSVTSIDAEAFYNCGNLKYIFFEGTEDSQKELGDALVTNAKIHYGSSTHTFNENYTVDTEPTCTEKGSESQHCKYCDLTRNSRDVKENGHTSVNGGKIDVHTKCDVCGVTLSAEHEFTKTVIKAPTCTSQGVETWACECGYSETNNVEESDHNFVNHDGKVATCTEDGYYPYQTCTTCDYTTYHVDPAKGHDIVIDKAVEATCTKTGLTEGSHCTRCNDKTVKQNVIPTKAHTEVTVTGKAATCTATGLTDGKKCSVCGTVTKAQETIKATGHTTSVINKKDATCTVDGYTGDTYCSVCKTTTVKGTVVKATGHKEVVIPAVAPTYTTVGKTEGKKCSVCGTITVAQKDVAKLTLAVPTVTIKNTAKGINVSWNKVNGAESYIVYRRTYNEKTKKWSSWSRLKTGVTATSYTDTTVKLGTKYRYTVKSVNGDVASKYISTSTLNYNVAPTVKVANASNGVKVSWSTVANATGYTVYSSTYNTKTKKWSGWKNRGTAKATATSWVDKNATKSGAYYKYTVRACNGKDIKSSYNKDGVKTLFLATPTVKIANNAKGVKVTWNKITGSKGYIIYRSEINNGKWSNWKNMGTVKNTILSWVDKNAQSGTTYRYTVRAVNGNYKSAYKASGSLIFLSQPTVKVANASNGIKVSWNKVDGVTGYTVYSSTYDAKTKKWSSWKNRGTAKANKTSWVDKNVKSGVTYKYTVRAVNGKTRSTYVSSSALLYLAQPTVTVKATSNGINVSWTQCAGSNGYTVYRSELVNGEWSNWTNMGTAKSDKKSWTDKKAKKGVTYKYTVRAVNADTGAKSSYIASKNVKR